MEERQGATWIYALKEADADEVRYVGASVDPIVRLRVHLKSNSSKALAGWIDRCKEREGEIELVCLERVPVGSVGPGNRHPSVAEAEDRWIVRLLDEGHRLLNVRRPQTHNVSAVHNKDLMEDAIRRGVEMFGNS